MNKTSAIMVKCPHCGEEMTNLKIENHLRTCKLANKLSQKMTIRSLRYYLSKKILATHPKCPICSHKYVTAITKRILEGEPYSDIIKVYSGKANNPTFTKVDLSNHKKHLHLDKIAVMEIEKKRKKADLTPSTYGTDEIIPNRRSKKYLDVIGSAIVSKGQKVNSLELLQIAKLEVAKKLYAEIDRRSKGEAPVPEGSSGLNHYSSIEFGALHDLFLKYMKDISDIQFKVLKYFEDIPLHNSHIDMNIIVTTVQNREIEIIKALVDNITDTEVRSKITSLIGSILNKLNDELKLILSSNKEVKNSPIDAVYEEIKEAIIDD